MRGDKQPFRSLNFDCEAFASILSKMVKNSDSFLSAARQENQRWWLMRAPVLCPDFDCFLA